MLTFIGGFCIGYGFISLIDVLDQPPSEERKSAIYGFIFLIALGVWLV